MKIGILGVGTELTTGQISNTNATWFANQFKKMGIETSVHMTVPDEKSLILKAFEILSEVCDIIITTGGLGPTSDDFTRQIFSEWSQTPLEWNEDAWKHIHDRLIPRGIAVKNIQKQQCYFPLGSFILENNMGTAHGFKTVYNKKFFYFLPGPPKEISTIWEDSMKLDLEKIIPKNSLQKTLSWDTIGVGESEVAEKIESLRVNHPELSSIDIGYRVHLPYVEVKMTFHLNREKELSPLILSIEDRLSSITVLKNGTDVAETLAEKLLQFKHIQFEDKIEGSFLLRRLFPFLKPHLKKRSFSFQPNFTSDNINLNSMIESSLIKEINPDPHSMSKIILRVEEIAKDLKYSGQGYLEILSEENKIIQCHQFEIESPYVQPLMREREQQYFAEMTMLNWLKVLR